MTDKNSPIRVSNSNPWDSVFYYADTDKQIDDLRSYLVNLEGQINNQSKYKFKESILEHKILMADGMRRRIDLYDAMKTINAAIDHGTADWSDFDKLTDEEKVSWAKGESNSEIL